MSNLIENVLIQNDKMNVKLSGTGDSIKLLTTKDIKNVAELYKMVHEELQQANCDKFLHALNEEQIEELVSTPGAALVGYFKDQKLAGALYTKPNEEGNKYFKTPSFDGDKQTYIIGGLAVSPEFRGNGIIPKLTNVAVNGVKDFALANPESQISGAGFEISCENFGSLMSLGYAKDENMKPIFNFAGLHYIEQPETKDNDLTVLGYTSFDQSASKIETLPFIILDGNQAKSYEKLSDAVEQISTEAGLDKTTVDGHTIQTFSNYVETPFKEIIAFDTSYASQFPPVLEK